MKNVQKNKVDFRATDQLMAQHLPYNEINRDVKNKYRDKLIQCQAAGHCLNDIIKDALYGFFEEKGLNG